MHRTQDMDEKRSFNLFLEFIYKLIHNLSPFTTTGFLHKFHQLQCTQDTKYYAPHRLKYG